MGTYGLRTPATDGTAATFASKASIRDFTAGSLTDPLATCHTMVSESPACLGSAEPRRVSALEDSVPGSVNESV